MVQSENNFPLIFNMFTAYIKFILFCMKNIHANLYTGVYWYYIYIDWCANEQNDEMHVLFSYQICPVIINVYTKAGQDVKRQVLS